METYFEKGKLYIQDPTVLGGMPLEIDGDDIESITTNTDGEVNISTKYGQTIEFNKDALRRFAAKNNFVHIDNIKRLADSIRFSSVVPDIVSFTVSNRINIEKVIFNDPATIVFWTDGTKTIVKCQEGDTFDKEKGLAMAIAKRCYGNTGKYCEEFKEWCGE